MNGGDRVGTKCKKVSIDDIWYVICDMIVDMMIDRYQVSGIRSGINDVMSSHIIILIIATLQTTRCRHPAFSILVLLSHFGLFGLFGLFRQGTLVMVM